MIEWCDLWPILKKIYSMDEKWEKAMKHSYYTGIEERVNNESSD